MHQLNFVGRIVLTFILFFSSQVLEEDKFQLWVHETFERSKRPKLFINDKKKPMLCTTIVTAKNLKVSQNFTEHPLVKETPILPPN